MLDQTLIDYVLVPGGLAPWSAATGAGRLALSDDDGPMDQLSGDPDADFRVRMTVQQWRSVDGSVDNEISVEAENGDPRQVVDPAISIREAGWEQAAHWTRGVPSSGAWPPDDQEVVVELSGAQWDLVVECLVRWGAVAGSCGNDIEAAGLQSIHDLVVDQIAAERPD